MNEPIIYGALFPPIFNLDLCYAFCYSIIVHYILMRSFVFRSSMFVLELIKSRLVNLTELNVDEIYSTKFGTIHGSRMSGRVALWDRVQGSIGHRSEGKVWKVSVSAWVLTLFNYF